MFAGWQEGQLSINIAKYLFFILLALFIYSIFAFVPIIKKQNEFIKSAMSAIVAFLATAYLTPSDVYTALASYGALGIALGGILPFIILLFFSIEVQKKGGFGGVILSKAVWAIFIVFLIYKIFSGIYFCEIRGAGTSTIRCINAMEGWIYVGLIIAAFIWIFSQRAIVKSIFKQEIRQETENLENSSLIELEGEFARAQANLNALIASGSSNPAALAQAKTRVKGLKEALKRAKS